MSRTKKARNKPYKPKFTAANPMAVFFGGMSGDYAGHLQLLNLKNASALQSIIEGRATRDHWDLLVGAVNMGNVMSEQGIGPEYRADTLAARDVLLACRKRYDAEGVFSLTVPELAIMDEFMAIHEAQLAACRSIDVDRMADEVTRRVRRNLTNPNHKRPTI